MFGDKKGLYYTMDAVLAGFLLMSVVLIITSSSFQNPTGEQSETLSKDLMTGLDEVKLTNLNSDFIDEEANNGNISDLNQSIVDLIGYYWATNQSDKAEKAFTLLSEDVLGYRYGARVTVNEEEIFFKNGTGPGDNIYTATRMISGVDEEVPLEGASASAYLKRIRNKKSSAYAYLGGFVGQGNISFTGEKLPGDINESQVEELYLEGDFASDFKFYINEEQCVKDESVFSVTGENLTIDSWSLEECKDLLEPEINKFGIEFQGDIEDSYASGGLVRVDYRTDELQEETAFGEDTYDFPSIHGISNLFDSFYIPGTLEEMNIHLNYETNDSAYISVGERIIDINDEDGELEEGVEGEVYENDIREYNVTLSNEFLINEENLDYGRLSDNTVPLRFASYDTTEEVIESGDADVVIISDYSRSMMRAIDNWGMGNRRSECEDALDDSETRRTDLATCLNKEFADNILNFTGNRLWPVYMHDDEIEYYDNPEDLEAIKGYMDGFSNGQGRSCVACAVNQAYDLLDEYSNESREQFIVVMTDGVPTHCADGSCSSNSAEYGTQQCQGICNQAGNCPSNQREDQCQECIDNPGAADNLYHSSERVVEDLNADIFTIGFGPFENECSFAGEVLGEVADIGNGTYQHSQDNVELQEIYENVSQEILTRIEQENQTVSVQEGEVKSNLLEYSHIEFQYQPLSEEPSPGKISVTMEESLPLCNNTVEIPGGLDIIDAKVASYSGPHWSDLVVVNEETAFNMSDYLVPYYRLGDPFEIQVPVDMLEEGENQIFVETGDSPENRTGCSEDDRFIYTALIPSATTRTDVKEETKGCQWTVDFEDGDQQDINVPTDYDGSNTCTYQPDNINFNENDTYDVAMYDLLSQLDTNNNGNVLININELDLEVTTTVLEEIPYLWGPALLRLEVWV